MQANYMKYALAALALCLVLPWAGCKTEPDRGDALPRRQAEPKTVRALIASQQALHQGRYLAALSLADSPAKWNPRLADAHFQRGRALSELHRFEQAEAAYRKVLALNPKYRGAWFNLGNNAFRQHEYRQALTFYQKAQRRHPTAATLVYMGRTYARLGKTDSTQWAYRKAIALDSTHAAAHFHLGETYEQAGQPQKALASYRRALKQAPDNPEYRYAVGRQLVQLGEAAEAVRHLEAVVRARPRHLGAQYSLAQALLRLGHTEEAQRYLTQVDSLQQLKDEVERLSSIVGTRPEDPRLWARLGDALRRGGRSGDALEAYQTALALAPRSSALRGQVARLHALLGNEQAAVAHYRLLLQLHPDYVRGWLGLGVVYAQMGAEEKARQAWETVLRQDPDHPKARAYLARLGGPS